MAMDSDLSELAERVGRGLALLQLTIAVAESLTGGLLASTFASMEGATDFFFGGLVAYSPEVKFNLLGVTRGPVITQQAADQMALGAKRLFASDLAVAVTGVGGPDPHEGRPPGTVFLALVGEQREPKRLSLSLDGDPTAICEAVCLERLRLVDANIGERR